MGGNAKDAWTARSRKLDERKLSNIYPATKVRKTTSWRNSKAESPSDEKAAPRTAKIGVSEHQALRPQPAEQPREARLGRGTSLKLPLQECISKKDQHIALAIGKVSESSKEAFSLYRADKRGPPASRVLQPQVPSTSGGRRMGEAFGSQFQADEAIEQAVAKARPESALQPGYVDSDVTTEDESGEADDDEVTCSLAEWRVNVGMSPKRGPEERATNRGLPDSWPGSPPALDPPAAPTGILGQHQKAEVGKVQNEQARNEEIRAKRVGPPSDAEQRQKRQKLEARMENGGVAAALCEPPPSIEPQAEHAQDLGASARLRLGGKGAVAREGAIVAITLPEVALGALLPGGPSSSRSSEGTSPFPTPVIQFFDRVMSERGGGVAGGEASGRGSQAGREGHAVLQPEGVLALENQQGNQNSESEADGLQQHPARGVGDAGQGHANLRGTEALLHEFDSGARLGEVPAQSEVRQGEGGQPGLTRRDSIYSPGDDFWSEALAIAAALEVQKERGGPNKAGNSGEGQEGRGAAAGSGLLQAIGPPDKGGPLETGDRLVRGGAQGLQTAIPNRGLPHIHVAEPEDALEPPNSQSPLPVRQLAFTPPEQSLDQASSLQPPLGGPVPLHSSQRAEREELPRPPKDSAAAAAAAALLAPAIDLPRQLNHSLSKARTPLNSLATCALQTGPSPDLTFQTLAEGLHDTIEESDSHAEDSISQFETQPESSPEDGGELHGVAEGGLVFGAVEMAQPTDMVQQGAQPLAQGLVRTDVEPLGFPVEPAAVSAEANRLEEPFHRRGPPRYFPEHGAGPGSQFYERFPVGDVSQSRGGPDDMQAQEAALDPRHSVAAIGMLSTAPIGSSAGGANPGVNGGVNKSSQAQNGRPVQHAEGKVQEGLGGLAKEGGGAEGDGGFGGQAGGKRASHAREEAQVGVLEAHVRVSDSQFRRGGVDGQGAAGNVGPEETRSENTPPHPGAESDKGIRPEETVESAADGVNGPHPLEDSEDPIECSLASQAEPSGQLNPSRKALGARAGKPGGSQRTAGRVGPFAPLSSPFSPRPAARKPAPEPGANQPVTAGASGEQPRGTSREPVRTPAGPSSQQQGAGLHPEGGTPTQPLSLTTPGGAPGRVSEGGDSEPASCELRNYLPAEVCAVYASKGVGRMYQWQADALSLEDVMRGKSLVFCASTSAGKSLVAEVLMIRRTLATEKKAVLVLPYVALCAEKADQLEKVLEPLGRRVRGFYGSKGGGSIPPDTAVAVCTIEKANILLNKILEDGKLSEIGIVVIDELHMVGDEDRGYLLELLLTKLRFAAGGGVKVALPPTPLLAGAPSTSNHTPGGTQTASDGTSQSSTPSQEPGLQIVGMSATMPNVEAVAQWLDAALYKTDFRPVPLEEFVKTESLIYDKHMRPVRSLPVGASREGKDQDHLVELCDEVVRDGHSCLIFCATKKSCEVTAKHVAKLLPRRAISQHEAELAATVEELSRNTTGADVVLAETLPNGVAYHHAGLTSEEREIVEGLYRKGAVKVLAATSTLAAGVNLPARRVIFRAPKVGIDYINGVQYRQMSGRAGRAGIDTKGESILMCTVNEQSRVRALLESGCQPLVSCLTEDSRGMTRALLEVVAAGIVQTPPDVQRYIRCTLLATTRPTEEVSKVALASLKWLGAHNFIEWESTSEDGKRGTYSPTPLGRAAFGSSLTPEESLIVFTDLARAREAFVMATELHTVYLVTPVYIDVAPPDWQHFARTFWQMTGLEQNVGTRVGIEESFLHKLASGVLQIPRSNPVTGRHVARIGASPKKSLLATGATAAAARKAKEEDQKRICQRFYAALVLSKLSQEMPLTEVAQWSGLPKGTIQGLQDAAGRFSVLVAAFCERLGWRDMQALFTQFHSRVSFGVKAECIELTEIPNVRSARARALFKAGLRTPQAVAEASVEEIASALAAGGGAGSRGLHLATAKKIRVGARQIVVEKAKDAAAAMFSNLSAIGMKVSQRQILPLVSQETLLQAEPLPSPLAAEATPNEKPAPGPPGTISAEAPLSNLGGARPQLQSPNEKEPTGEFTRPLHRPGKEPVDMDIDEGPVNDGVAWSNQPASGVLVNRPQFTRPETAQSNLGASHSVRPQVDDPRSNPRQAAMQTETRGLSRFSDEQQSNRNGALVPALHNGMPPPPAAGICFSVHANRSPEPLRLPPHSGPVDVDKLPGGFDAFYDHWASAEEFAYELHISGQEKAKAEGGPWEIEGLAVAWEGSPVFYVSLARAPKARLNGGSLEISKTLESEGGDLAGGDRRRLAVEQRWQTVRGVFEKRGVRKVSWDVKEQLLAFGNAIVATGKEAAGSPVKEAVNGPVKEGVRGPLGELWAKQGGQKKWVRLPGICPADPLLDVRIANWMLLPDKESARRVSLETLVKERIDAETTIALSRAGRWADEPGSHSRVAANGCCRRVAQVAALWTWVKGKLSGEGLLDPLGSVEMPLVRVLGDMEKWGIVFDSAACRRYKGPVVEKLRILEGRARQLVGWPEFNLYSPQDVSEVLFQRLQLPVPPGTKRSPRHISTDKSVLQALRDQHPVIELILEHRTLAKLLKSTIEALLQEAKTARSFGPDADGLGCDADAFGRRSDGSGRTPDGLRRGADGNGRVANGDGRGMDEFGRSTDGSGRKSDGFRRVSGASERGGRAPRLQKIYGTWLHTAAATGRLAMEDPSLQCIQHSISFSLETDSARRRLGGASEQRNRNEGTSDGMTTKAGSRDQTLAAFGAAQRRKSGTQLGGTEARTDVGRTGTAHNGTETERNQTDGDREISRRLSGGHTRRVEVNIRSVFVPTSHSWALMSADYAQVEIRMMAHFSGDAGLVALLSTPGGDLFRMIAAKWASIDEAEVLPKQREAAKHLTYGILYGMGVEALAEKLGVSSKEAATYRTGFLTAFPGVTKWIDSTQRACQAKGYVSTLSGRRRYLEHINNGGRQKARAERQAVNSVCQGSAADLIKLAMINVHGHMTGRASTVSETLTPPNGSLVGKCRLLLQIHDELLLEVEESALREVARMVRSSMENVVTLAVPLQVKLQVGPSWGQLQAYDERLTSHALPTQLTQAARGIHGTPMETDCSPIRRGG